MISSNGKDCLNIYNRNKTFSKFSTAFFSGIHLWATKCLTASNWTKWWLRTRFLSRAAKHLRRDESLSEAGLLLYACRTGFLFTSGCNKLNLGINSVLLSQCVKAYWEAMWLEEEAFGEMGLIRRLTTLLHIYGKYEAVASSLAYLSLA